MGTCMLFAWGRIQETGAVVLQCMAPGGQHYEHTKYHHKRRWQSASRTPHRENDQAGRHPRACCPRDVQRREAARPVKAEGARGRLVREQPASLLTPPGAGRIFGPMHSAKREAPPGWGFVVS